LDGQVTSCWWAAELGGVAMAGLLVHGGSAYAHSQDDALKAAASSFGRVVDNS
jgi:hypothetical protein